MCGPAMLVVRFGKNTAVVNILMNYVQLFIDCQDCRFIDGGCALYDCRDGAVAGNPVGFLFPNPMARM
jgi:hypothetical protein